MRQPKKSPRLIQADGGGSGYVIYEWNIKYFSFFCGVTRSRKPVDPAIRARMAKFVLVALVGIGNRFVRRETIRE